jgi:hypothetical protein
MKKAGNVFPANNRTRSAVLTIYHGLDRNVILTTFDRGDRWGRLFEVHKRLSGDAHPTGLNVKRQLAGIA